MDASGRLRLLGRCRTPRVRVGRFVRRLLRGAAEVVGLTDAPLPRPLGKTARRPAISVYAGLAGRRTASPSPGSAPRFA
jgi:hypothetical protein